MKEKLVLLVLFLGTPTYYRTYRNKYEYEYNMNTNTNTNMNTNNVIMTKLYSYMVLVVENDERLANNSG